MVAFEPEKKPEEEAYLEAEIENRAAIDIDRPGRRYEPAISAIDDVDVQADQSRTDNIANGE